MTTIEGSLEVRLDETLGRATPPPAERAFREALRDGAGVLLDGVERAAGSLPGGGVVSAVTSALGDGAGGSAAGGAGSPGAAGGMDDLLSRSALQQMELLALQQRMQDENQRFSALSNVLKAEHETAKTAIGNIR
jgi:hypothetical protein